ncbi:MAG: aminotransferase class IV [Candidatus Neomarinimicrobiota bacterium]
MLMGTHAYDGDVRNENILIHINGELYPRREAKVSVFDSGFLLGDGVWEGIRLHKGQLLFLSGHLTRLYDGAGAIDLDIGMTPESLTGRIRETVEANGMETDVHIRLVVSRGLKATPFQHPAANVEGPTIVIIAEYKVASEATQLKGIRLVTVDVRRGGPTDQDPRVNSLSKYTCISACIQADKAGADEALMLDPNGYVSTCNSTNFFVVRQGAVWTSTGQYCLNGVTRANVIRLCRENGLGITEGDYSLTEVYGAEEAFVTGTFGGVIPVMEVDGRPMGKGQRGRVTARIQGLYGALVEQEAARGG